MNNPNDWYPWSTHKHPDFVEDITEYMLSLGFYVAPVSLTLNKFQEFKRWFYWLIGDKISMNLSMLFRKLSPVKLAHENREKEIWYHYRDPETKELTHEVLFSSCTMYTPGGLFYNGEYYMEMYNVRHRVESVKDVRKFLYTDYRFKSVLRNNLLEDILDVV
jgi:hypothetical protein